LEHWFFIPVCFSSSRANVVYFSRGFAFLQVLTRLPLQDGTNAVSMNILPAQFNSQEEGQYGIYSRRARSIMGRLTWRPCCNSNTQSINCRLGDFRLSLGFDSPRAHSKFENLFFLPRSFPSSCDETEPSPCHAQLHLYQCQRGA
jgi:hypothetical protein